MNRFLLLALTAGLLSPIAANAETYYLYWGTFTGYNAKKADRYGSTHINSTPFDSLANCEAVGEKVFKEVLTPVNHFNGRWTCVKK